MYALRSILGVAVTSSRWILRQPMWLVHSVSVTLAFAIILYAWGGVEAIRNLIIAWFVSGAWSIGVNIVAQEVGWSRVDGKLDMVIASPVTPLTYFAGVLLGSLLFLPADIVPIAAVAAAVGSLHELVAGVVSALLLLPVATLLGLTIVMRIRRYTNISAITNTLASTLQLLPPVFYPATTLPPLLKPVTLIAPTSAAAELARGLAGLPTVYTPVEAVAALAAWLAALLVSTKRVVRWGLE